MPEYELYSVWNVCCPQYGLNCIAVRNLVRLIRRPILSSDIKKSLLKLTCRHQISVFSAHLYSMPGRVKLFLRQKMHLVSFQNCVLWMKYAEVALLVYAR